LNPASSRWITRKEIAHLVGLSYHRVAQNKESLELAAIRVRLNARVIIFPREHALEKLRAARLLPDENGQRRERVCPTERQGA
jgi:hypothetical protein